MYKCYFCKLVLEENDLVDYKCPTCGGEVKIMCKNDTKTCGHETVSGVKICDECGEFMCPICGCHDVNAIS